MNEIIDPFDSADTASNIVDPFDTSEPGNKAQPESSTIRRALGDTGISLLKGAIGVPETMVGIADLVTGGHAGKLAESAGFKPKQAKAIISDYYSPEQKLANQKVQEADGFVNTIKAALQNPSTIAQTTAESLPVMGLGGVGARGLLTVAPKLAPVIAGAAGEGVVTAGQNAEQLRQETNDGLLTGKQAAIQAGSGLLTGAISAASGSIAQKLGIADIDTMLAQGKLTPAQMATSLPKAIVGGVVSEGVLEEMPQSAQEQAALNLSLDKPIGEGVGNAAAMGALSGGLMGGGANALNHFGGKDDTQVTPPPAPPAPEGSLTSAATIAQAVGLTPQPVTPDVTTEAKPNIVDSLNAVEAQQAQANAPMDAPAPTIAPEQAAEKQRIDELAQQAATSPLNDLPQPTEAQAAAGNYKKGHIKYDGLNITVENPQGSTRSGTDEDGKPWSNTLQHHYGYIKRTKGNDGDNLDVFVGDKPASGKVFVINQTKKDGSFDEHKAILGAETADEAIAIYKTNYADDWNGGKSVTELTTPAFKDWLKNGDPTKPLETVSATSNDVDMTKVAVGEQVDVGGVPYVKTENGFERVTSATNVDTTATLPERVDETANGVQNYVASDTDSGKTNSLSRDSSWVIRDKATGETIMETFQKSVADKVNPEKYEAVPILQHLQELNEEGSKARNYAQSNNLLPAITPVNESVQPTDTVRPLVEQLTKLRATADKHPSFDPALKAAKDFMAGKKVSPKQFKNFANLLGKKNKAFSEVLMQLHDQAASTPEQLAAKDKKSKLAKAMLEERMKLDTTKDGLMQAIAKLGGLNADKAKAEFGINPADMKQHGAGIKRSFNKNGLDADTMRELLKEQGYPVGESVADLGNAIADAMSGVDVLTAEAQETLAQKKYEEYANAISELSDDEQALLDELVTQATAKYGAEALAEIDASLAESMKGQPQPEIERALLRMLKEEFEDETGNAGTSQVTAGKAGQDTEGSGTENDSRRAQQDGASNEDQGSETSQDLLGDSTAAKQAIADAERAKDAKRNSGTDNQDTFNLTGSNSEADQAAAAGAQDLFSAPQTEIPAEETGVDDKELKKIVSEFDDYQQAMLEDDFQVHHLFDQPAKNEIVRLQDKAKVYHKDHGWMTVEQAKAKIAEWKEHAAGQYENGKTRSANNQKVVLSLFDLTGSWSKPWEEAGYQVYRFDIQDEIMDEIDGETININDINNFSSQLFNDYFGGFEGNDIYAILAATPCTDFASSGARHFAAKDADGRTAQSVQLVHMTLATIEHFKPSVWAIENPVGRIEKLGSLPPWRLSFDPNHLGDPYTKKTLLWGRFNADLPVAPVEPTEGSKMHTQYGGKSLATKNARSATPEGFSYGFFMANNAADHPEMAIANKHDRLDRDLITKAIKAGVTEAQIDEAVEDYYYMDMDDDAANEAIQELIDGEIEDDNADDDTQPAIRLESPAEQPKPETKPAENIQDLGEKIGGARKDTAVSTGTKAKRTNRNPDVPTWAKRYNIVEIAIATDKKDAGTWSIYDSRDKNRFGHPREIGKGFASKEAAIAELPALVVGAKHRVVATAQRADGTYGFEIYRSINDRKRVKIVDKEFDSRVEALTYMGEHAAEILETNTTFGEVDLPTPDDTNRIGVERRSDDVQSQDFMDTFGFRGVEFGNWNNQIERQQVMNAAYDGLLDLAEVLNLPPKSLTLNGDLALAFGARGQGLSSAKAHYERHKSVINLTKMNGAGSLAHEFFHALDHYLGRQDGKASSEWITDSDGTRSLKVKDAEDDMVSSGFSYKSNVRDEVRAAYKDLMETMFRKATTYVEDTQQADKFVATAKEDLASKLDSIRNDLSAQKDPKYYKRNNKPATAEQLAEFDTIAKQLLDGQSLDAEYRAIDDGKKRTRKWQLPSGRHTNDALEKISAIYKAVRGRNGFDSQNNHGTLDYLRGTMSRYSGRLKMLADAQQGSEKVKYVPSDFALNAKELDQGRGTDYWTTPHEMAARAFQGYVEDKVAATGGKSPFLNYGREGAGILTPWGVKFPFPRGEERKAINAALDKFVSALQTKETDKSTSLYSRGDGFKNNQSSLNANNKPIYSTKEGIANFWEWFNGFRDQALERPAAGGENARGLRATTARPAGQPYGLDDQGRPKIFLHGTASDFSTFDFEHAQRKDHGWLGDGVYLTDDPLLAQSYSNLKAGDAAPNIMPVYAAIHNPFYATIQDKQKLQKYSKADIKAFTERLKAEGYDGVVLQFNDETSEVVALYPNQVKSAVGNNGDFDTQNNDILYSRPSAPTFYSALAIAIPQAKQDAMPAGQWKSWLIANAGKMNVKQAELQWSGLTDWLDLQQGKVSKADIQQYLDANGVQVTETMLGSFDNSIALKNLKDAGYTFATDLSGEKSLIDKNGDDVELDDLPESLQKDFMSLEGEYESLTSTKYGKYTVAGGENYKELLLTLPDGSEAQSGLDGYIQELRDRGTDLANQYDDAATDAQRQELQRQISDNARELNGVLNNRVSKGNKYRSSHFDQPNILAHVRFDERIDADGNKVLFINEIQSDWGQEGKKKGFKTDSLSKAERDDFEKLKLIPHRKLTQQQVSDLLYYQSTEKVGVIPPAPFVTETKSWVSLALKRMVRYAAENGFDKVALINGQQAADLYDLSKVIGYLNLNEPAKTPGFNKDIKTRYVLEGYQSADSLEPIMVKGFNDLSELDDIIGKEAAKQLVDKVNADGYIGVAELRGEQLAVGGHGMRVFYDQIVPQVANDVLKKIGGGKVEKVDIGAISGVNDYGESIDESVTPSEESNQLGFTITPELRAKALEGLPLFSRPQSKFSQKSKNIDIRDLNAVVANVNQALRGLPLTHVLEDYTKAPAELVADIKRDKAYDAAGAWHNGEIYLFRNNIINTNHALFTMLHESTHEGLRRVFGKEIDATLMGIYLSNKDIKQQADALRATHKDLSLVGSVEESLADMGGNGIKASVMDKLVAFVRNFLRRLGMNLTVSDGEVRVLVTRALDSLKSPSKVTHYTIGSAYSKPTPRLSPVVQSNTPNQQWQNPDKSKLDNVIYMLQNKFVDLKRVIQGIQKAGNSIDDKWNPYLQEELYTGRTATRTKDFIKHELEPLMKSMQARKVDMADFEEYLWARHAEERNIQIAKINPAMQDGGSGMTTQDARDYLANLTPVQSANYQALAAKVDAILKNSRQRLISYGLETPETIAAWEGAYQHYVPLMREDMDNGFGNGSGQGFSVKGNASKRATGSNRAVVDVLANIAQQVERNIIRGEKNRVSTALVGLATLNPNKDFWKVDVVPTMRTVVAGKNSYEVLYNGSLVQPFTNPVEANKFIQWNGAGYTLNVVKGQDLVMDVPDPSYKSRDNVVVARIVNANGKIEEHFVEFNTHDERAMRSAAAIKNLDQDQIGELLGTSARITRYFSSINTQYNPFFGVINILRDVQGSLLNLSSTPLSGKQVDVLKNTPLALIGIYNDIRSERKTGTPTNSYWSLLFEDFQKQGGQTGYRDMFRNAKERGEALRHALDPTWWQQTTAGKIVSINGILAKPEQFLIEKGQQYIFDWLSDYNESMENAVRLSAYKVGLDNGMAKAQAASLAKNISVNFNRKGEMGRQIGSLYAFFNASVQGTARIGETLFTDNNGKLTLSKAGKAIVTGGLLLGVMQALMLAAAGFGDDEPPDFVRDRNLIIPLGNKKAITIAMPLGFNALPAFGRILTEWALSGGKDTSKRFVHIFDMLADVTNPIGNAGLSMQTIAPTILDPVAALAENKDWTNRPIAKMDFNAQKPTAGHTRAKDTASAISKALSYYINAATGGTDYTPGALSPTPDQIDYLIGQLTGGVGREYMKLEQTATSMTTGEDLPVYKIPLVGRFYLDAEGQSSQSSRFYDNLKAVFETETELKGMRKDGIDTSEYRASHPEAALVFRANLEQREISQLHKMRSDRIKVDAAPEEIKMLNERITARMLRFNELFIARTETGE